MWVYANADTVLTIGPDTQDIAGWHPFSGSYDGWDQPIFGPGPVEVGGVSMFVRFSDGYIRWILGNEGDDSWVAEKVEESCGGPEPCTTNLIQISETYWDGNASGDPHLPAVRFYRSMPVDPDVWPEPDDPPADEGHTAEFGVILGFVVLGFAAGTLLRGTHSAGQEIRDVLDH